MNSSGPGLLSPEVTCGPDGIASQSTDRRHRREGPGSLTWLGQEKIGATRGDGNITLRRARKESHLGRELVAAGWTIRIHEGACFQVCHRHAVELHVPALINQAGVRLLPEDDDPGLCAFGGPIFAKATRNQCHFWR